MDTESKITIKAEPRDIFGHLLAMCALYASAGSFLTLLFGILNTTFPDTLQGYGYGSGDYASMRFAIAMLCIVFPIYLFTMRHLKKEYRAMPEKQMLRIRKWLVYFTLFIASLTMIGDVIALINHFLNGELTTRFVLKVLAVFIVAGAVFFAYKEERGRENIENKSINRVFRYGISVIVLTGIITGFLMVGSPSSERARRFDDERINNLQFLQSEIVFYWQNKHVLPSNLDALKDDIRGVRPPLDPETGASYGYAIKDAESFSLCATFKTESTTYQNKEARSMPAMPYASLENNWEHDVGNTCFERHIDPEVYKKEK